MADGRAIPTRVRKTEPVVIGVWCERNPAFHKAKDYIGPSAQPVTRCGRTLSPYSAILRGDHASMFGHPCKVCFPDG